MKGILFKDWKIKAIAEDDREWQTRRLGGLKEINKEPDEWVYLKGSSPKGKFHFYNETRNCRMTIKPRYQIGEVVYIKEAWCPLIAPVYNLLDPTIPTVYKQEMDAGGATLPKEFKWHSPMRMPEWAARLFGKITAIKIGRLKEITWEEAEQEGFKRQEWENNLWVFVYSFKKAEK